MRIDGITLYRLRLPLRHPWQTAYGIEKTVDTLYLHAFGCDVEAWVECGCLRDPRYLPETSATTAVMIRDCFGPQICGVDFQTAAELYDRLAEFRGNTFAKAALELCWWALCAVAENKPLHELLGGAAKAVPAGIGIGAKESPNAMLQAVAAAVAKRAPRVKLKFRRRQDLPLLQAVRDKFPHLALQIDCNGAFQIQDLELFKELDQLGLVMIEQPLHFRDLSDHATLQKQLKTPICLDESIREPADAERAIRLGAARIINLKPGRVGGLTAALRIVALCRDADVGCWVGGMLETALGTSVNLALATVPGMTHAHDLPVSGRFYADEPITPALAHCSPGQLQPSPEPWVGRQVDPDQVKNLALTTDTIRPAKQAVGLRRSP